jgi:tryptophan 7-halogenase
MGFAGRASSKLPAPQSERAEACFHEAAELTRKMLPALPSHRELIEHIRRHGLSRI